MGAQTLGAPVFFPFRLLVVVYATPKGTVKPFKADFVFVLFHVLMKPK